MQLGAALGLALLGALAEHRTAARLADGASHAAAQLSGYHLAFALGAGGRGRGPAVTLLVLRSPTPQHEPAARPSPRPSRSPPERRASPPTLAA